MEFASIEVGNPDPITKLPLPSHRPRYHYLLITIDDNQSMLNPHIVSRVYYQIFKTVRKPP
jgi:hypothetical protein